MPKENKNGKRKIKSCDTPKRAKKPKVEKIAKSKQLAAKITKKQISRRSISDNTSKVCCNGKPMPSLAELERMFEESEDEDICSSPQQNNVTAEPPKPLEVRCETPPPTESEKPIPFSPNTVKEFTNKVLEYVCNNDPVTIFDEDAPPPPVIPPKKRKKPEKPYIDGCKDRKQISDWRSSVVVGAGDDDYGVNIDDAVDSDESSCREKKKRCKNGKSISKSIFNAQADSIASMWKTHDLIERASIGSSDSSKTINYDFSNIVNKTREFSPIPSTSKDNETILKNEINFSESFQIHNSPVASSDNDIEVIDTPCETIVVEDSVQEKHENTINLIDSEVEEVKPKPSQVDIIPEDDVFCSIIDLDDTNDNDCEIIDVNELISQNEQLISKFKNEDINQVVTVVEPQRNASPIQQPAESSSVICVDSTIEPPKNEIGSVVSNFFKNNSEVIDLSDSNIIDSTQNNNRHQNKPMNPGIHKILSNCVQSLVNTFASFVPNINLSNTNNVNVRGSVQIIQTNNDTIPQNQTSLPATSTPRQVVQAPNTQNLMSNNSVILVDSSVQDLNSPSLIRRPRKGGKRKTKNQDVSNCRPQIASPIATGSPGAKTSRSIGDCPICLDNLATLSVASTVCGHIFCMSCIQKAVQTNKRCPTCRKILKKNGFHQLFL